MSFFYGLQDELKKLAETDWAPLIGGATAVPGYFIGKALGGRHWGLPGALMAGAIGSGGYRSYKYKKLKKELEKEKKKEKKKGKSK